MQSDISAISKNCTHGVIFVCSFAVLGAARNCEVSSSYSIATKAPKQFTLLPLYYR